jgi:hypothetical protein
VLGFNIETYQPRDILGIKKETVIPEELLKDVEKYLLTKSDIYGIITYNEKYNKIEENLTIIKQGKKIHNFKCNKLVYDKVIARMSSEIINLRIKIYNE